MLHDVLVSHIWPTNQPVGPDEYRNKGLIDSATARPFHGGYGEEFYKTMAEKAAALFHSLSASHCFYNGNKRTAILALDQFLLANGYYLAVPNKEIYELATEAASYKERAISDREMFQKILHALKDNIVLLRKLKQERGMIKFYKQAMDARSFILNHELNRKPLPDPPESA